MEIGVHSHQHGTYSVRQSIQLHATHHKNSNKSQNKHHTTYQAKEMHGLFAKLVQEPQGEQIQIAIDKTAHTKLTLAELAFAVLNNFLANLSKTCILRSK